MPNSYSYNQVFTKTHKYPDRQAVYAEGRYHIYAELNLHIKYIYQQLCLNKIEAKRIAIICSNDFWTVATICAVLKYGAAYVPILNNSPLERKKWIINDVQPGLILAQSTLPELEKIPTLKIDFDDVMVNEDLELIPQISHSEAFILYTSGSTGMPKGVPVPKDGLDHCFEWMFDYFNFDENDRFLQPFRWTFDISVFSFLVPLSIGACCYLLPKSSGIQSLTILDCLKKHEITVVCLVPSVISLTRKYLPELKVPSLRYSLFGGEALYNNLAQLWKNAFPNAQIVNMYGPSETTIYMSYYEWDFETSSKESLNNIVPLGKILPNHEFILLDINKIIEEKLTTGELCISGIQLIANYVNNIQQERFVELFWKDEKRIFYKTGDLVQINDNGNLLFIGRNDEQVQIQGHRVEVKEIEFHLSNITKVENVIIVKERNEAEKYLVAFIKKCDLVDKEIKNALIKHVPHYMIPRKIIFIDKLPRNLNGKVDKKALKLL